MLTHAAGTKHVILTPSRASRDTDFSSSNISKIVSWDGKKPPSRLSRGQLYLDVDSPKGAFTDAEIEAAIKARGKGVTLTRTRIRTKSPARRADALPLADGPVVATPPKQPGHARVPGSPGVDAKGTILPTGYKGTPLDGEGWYVFVGRGAAASGSQIALRPEDGVTVLGDYAVFPKDKQLVVCIWAKAEEVSDKLRGARIAASGRNAADFDGKADIYFDADATPKKDGQPGKGKSEEVDDLRVLPCYFEKDGRRFRKLQDAEPDMVEEAFDDWPVEGTRSMSHSMRELRRNARSWLQHHSEWTRLSGVAQTDRSVHEHRVLCTSLHHMVTYDQLAVVNLAGAETINARRELIEHAHEQAPHAPRWDGAKEFMGYTESASGTMVDPKKVAHVATVQGQKAKIIEASLKAKEANAAWLRRPNADNAALAAGKVPGGAKLKAVLKIKGEGKGGAGGTAENV